MATARPHPLVLLAKLELKHILVATDFSESSLPALKQAAAIARLHASDLLLVHVVPPTPNSYAAMVPIAWDDEAMREQAQRAMEELSGHDTLAGVEHSTLIESGYLEPNLKHLIAQREISLVVIGTHGRSGLRKLIMGSVAEEIFRTTASCPVLTVGPEVKSSMLSHGRFRSIVYATDFSSGSLSALPYALGFATESQAKLVLLHTIEAGSVSAIYLHERITQESRRRLAELVPPNVELPTPPELLVANGYPVEEILRTADENNADLIVLGVHKASGLAARTSAHLPWTIANGVVGHANCPVLTVRG
jgi:nucleotide-binding universal stress UspA family protein